jgi:hypothetical protein
MKSKFDASIYVQWMNQMLSIVNDFYLVIYTDEASSAYITLPVGNQRIRVIIKPVEEFYTYQYKESWIKNHAANYLLKDRVDWKVNMLWSEKVFFVAETYQRNYFDTAYYGWCDIGYFRNRPNDLNTRELSHWANDAKIRALNPNKIHYSQICDSHYLQRLFRLVNVVRPKIAVPPEQNSIAGGFFIGYRDKIEDWAKRYDEKLRFYFEHSLLVKDDQTILVDCILSDLRHFQLHTENLSGYDHWFMFQRILQ